MTRWKESELARTHILKSIREPIPPQCCLQHWGGTMDKFADRHSLRFRTATNVRTTSRLRQMLALHMGYYWKRNLWRRIALEVLRMGDSSNSSVIPRLPVGRSDI